MNPSQKLLADYVNTGSDRAFRELLERYIDLVHSVAVRLVDGDVHLAQDVTQKVFVDLAKLARTLPADVMLGGWLHRHTLFVAATVMRGERRRQSRERQAAEMNALEFDSHANLAAVAPILDEAIDRLVPEDRSAILLRFFEKLDFRSVGDALGGSEEAARKRVSRALEKLHAFLSQRGVTLSAAALSAALGAEAVTAAPIGLAGAIAGVALAGAGATVGGTTISVIKLMTLTKLKAGILGVVLVAGAATPIVLQHQSQERLQQANQSLRQQIEQAVAQTEDLSNRLHQALAAQAISQDQLSELLRLRGQVGALKKQISETAKATPASTRAAQAPAPSDGETEQEVMKQQFIAKMNSAKMWMLAFHLYAEKNGGNFPGSYSEAASFLPEDARQETLHEETLRSTNQFEIVYQGTVQSMTNPAMLIVLRENQATPAPNGGWARTYGFADGHSEVHRSDTGDFREWESQRMVSPAESQRAASPATGAFGQ
jgi:RNA polymerase sigma factor (sigma-70 family)